MAAPILSRDRPAFRAPLGAGDIAPSCVLATANGKTIDPQGDDIAGSPLVVAFWPRFDADPVQTAMASLGALLPSLESEGARIFGVTLANARAAGDAHAP
jgi:peroxiredoxin